MNTRFRQRWEGVRSSYWFIPSLMAVGAVLAALGAEALDRRISDELLQPMGWLFAAGPQGARALLTTIAGSMITVAGVTFSITMVALTLASTQFGPRLLGNFMRDRGNQVVLGTFVAAFLYCLVALRSVSGREGSIFVPQVTVILAVGFAVASIAVLIYFFDHVAASIQAPNVVQRVSGDVHKAIRKVFPDEEDEENEEAEEGGSGGPPAASGPPMGVRPEEGRPLPAPEDGYVQLLDLDRLVRVAEDHDLLLLLEVGAGEYLIRGAPLLRASPADGLDEEAERRLLGCFAIGGRQTLTDDLSFAVRQLVEIATRALSPSLNDPFTAMDCLDRLGSALAEVARRPKPPSRLADGEGRVRLLREPLDFPHLTDLAFVQIRLYGRSAVALLTHLQRTIEGIAPHVRRPEDAEALLRHVEATLAAAREGELLDRDRRAVEEAGAAARRALEGVALGEGG